MYAFWKAVKFLETIQSHDQPGALDQINEDINRQAKWFDQRTLS